MARKTKEDAELTRQRIIDAARTVFLARGVSRSSLEHIAAEAEVTRGAVYWHFKDKTELFHALRNQVFLPLIDRMDDALTIQQEADPLSQIENSLSNIIRDLTQDRIMRETYEIIMTKCEYVEDFASVLNEILNNCSNINQKFEQAYQRAQSQHLLAGDLTPAALALDTHLFFSGLLHMWVKDGNGTLFRHQALQLIHNHIHLRRK